MSTIFSSINLNSSPTRRLGEVDSLMGRQKSFQGGNDDVMSASVEPWDFPLKNCHANV
jgi:hypothetical protein